MVGAIPTTIRYLNLQSYSHGIVLPFKDGTRLSAFAAESCVGFKTNDISLPICRKAIASHFGEDMFVQKVVATAALFAVLRRII